MSPLLKSLILYFPWQRKTSFFNINKVFIYESENFIDLTKFIEKKEIDAGFQKNTLIQRGGNRSEVFLKGTVCDDVSLILRNGEIIEELINEVQTEGYDVTIIGKSKNSKKDYELTQYIDSSIFIANNYSASTFKIIITKSQMKTIIFWKINLQP